MDENQPEAGRTQIAPRVSDVSATSSTGNTPTVSSRILPASKRNSSHLGRISRPSVISLKQLGSVIGLGQVPSVLNLGGLMEEKGDDARPSRRSSLVKGDDAMSRQSSSRGGSSISSKAPVGTLRSRRGSILAMTRLGSMIGIGDQPQMNAQPQREARTLEENVAALRAAVMVMIPPSRVKVIRTMKVFLEEHEYKAMARYVFHQACPWPHIQLAASRGTK